MKNRTILITGGTRGIGLALACDLLAKGNTVIVTGRDKAQLDKICATVPGVHVIQSDVADSQAIVALHARVTGQHPTLDVLINNAGIMRELDLNQARSLDDVTREIDINLSGPVRMVQQFLPHLKKQPEALIVNVSSALAFVPLTLSPVYCATKAALHSFTQTLRMQLVGSQVSVVELAPPAVESELLRKDFAALDELKAISTAELSRRALAGIERGDVEIWPGQAALLKLLSRIAPEFALRQLAKTGRPKGYARRPKIS